MLALYIIIVHVVSELENTLKLKDTSIPVVNLAAFVWVKRNATGGPMTLNVQGRGGLTVIVKVFEFT